LTRSVEKAIKQANPAFGDFLNATEVLAMAEDARRMPSREGEYRNLVLNQRVDIELAVHFARAVWDSCGGAVHDWGNEPVYSGLDLSSTTILRPIVPICWIEDAWEVKPTFWLPGEGLREKSRSDRVPIRCLGAQGFLETTPGRAIEYEYVAQELYEFERTHNVAEIAFDRWG
jgi:phage terminase large subunit-like protein